jgi:FkbM family methyltransferase
MIAPDEQFYRHIKTFTDKKDNGFFIECGANNGYAGSICYLFEKNSNWTGLNVEPNPNCYSDLVKNRKNCINENIALSSKKTTTRFYLPTSGPRKKMSGCGSLLEASGSHIVEYDVNCDTYINIMNKHNIKEVDLMILDVEGAELDVLEGMKNSIFPKVIAIEYDKIDLTKLNEFMKQNNYTKVGDWKENFIYKRQ